MIVGYTYETRVGTFKVLLRSDMRWVAAFEDEALGTYVSAQHAIEDLAGGHTYWPSCGDPSRFGLPIDVGRWSPMRASVR